jgi:hypothetical protein
MRESCICLFQPTPRLAQTIRLRALGFKRAALRKSRLSSSSSHRQPETETLYVHA